MKAKTAKPKDEEGLFIHLAGWMGSLPKGTKLHATYGPKVYLIEVKKGRSIPKKLT